MTKKRAAAAAYPIRAASRLTGIAIDTLRAWERRYAAVTPTRDDRGRMYSDADLARLRLLHAAVARGHSIGRVAGLGDAELRRVSAAPLPDAPARGGVSPPATVNLAALTDALRAYDGVGIDQELSRLAAVLQPPELLREVLMPALVQVGEDWHRGRARIAHEHLMTAVIRNILGSFLRMYGRRDAATRLLFATPAGERHEIATLGAAMLAASRGFSVFYLGPDLPAGEIVDSVVSAGAHVLVLGLTTASRQASRLRDLRTIARDLPRQVELWAGGRGAELYGARLRPRALVLADYHAFERELGRLETSPRQAS